MMKINVEIKIDEIKISDSVPGEICNKWAFSEIIQPTSFSITTHISLKSC